MTIRAEVIDELRSLFKEGATPSRLIRHIAERHVGERALHSLIQAYFHEAFRIPIVRGLNPIDDYQNADLRYAFLNEHLIHEMVQRRGEWDNGAVVETEAESWLDSLTATDDRQRQHEVQTVNLPDLSESWSRLTSDEQHYIHGCLASAKGLCETVKILSRLVECLQQRLNEVEANC